MHQLHFLHKWSIPFLFLAGRLILLITLPMEGLRGFGDFVHFYRLAGMGWPFLDYWVEFPPIFPFLSSILFHLAGGREHVYDYLLILILSLFQAGTLALFLRLDRQLHPRSGREQRTWMYFVILLTLSYGWWYFDPLAVFAMMLGLTWLLDEKDGRAGIIIAAGTLIKWFPAMVLPLAWRIRPPRRAMLSTALTMGITIIVYGGLILASPENTIASLGSQASKGSWETVWALVDGNYNTGNFGPEIERFDPKTAKIPRGNPPRLPLWLTLIPFGLLGAWMYRKARISDPKAAIAFLGLTWSVFTLWSPGWSPQWLLYLLPLTLLALPKREGSLMAITLVLVNLLEWPVLLSRGYNWGLWLTVPLRTLLLVILVIEFWKVISKSQNTPLLEKEINGLM